MNLHRSIGRAEALVAASFLVAMVLLILLGGIARLVEHPLNWTGDVATCLFAWACFLCADIAWRNDSLMAFDLLAGRFPESVQKALRLANYTVISVFLLYLIGAGLWVSWTSRIRSFQGIPEISYSWITMSLPVGAALLLATTLTKIRAEVTGGATPPSPAARGG
jgi:TRAP-type C4-dicarboxylate transport system permease small subunit